MSRRPGGGLSHSQYRARWPRGSTYGRSQGKPSLAEQVRDWAEGHAMRTKGGDRVIPNAERLRLRDRDDMVRRWWAAEHDGRMALLSKLSEEHREAIYAQCKALLAGTCKPECQGDLAIQSFGMARLPGGNPIW